MMHGAYVLCIAQKQYKSVRKTDTSTYVFFQMVPLQMTLKVTLDV